MTTILAIVNQKGGVGKTTTAINLATSLAAVGKKTCVIDLDPQGNASTGLGIERSDRKITSYDLLLDPDLAQSAIVKTNFDNLYAIPATIDLTGAELEIANQPKRETKLKSAISRINENEAFDYILIDCPPSLNLLTINALVAADRVMVPLQCEFYALEGLSHLLKTIRIVQKRYNKSLAIEGIVLTMYDKRNKLTENIETDVREYLGEQVYKTVIPRNVRVSEAPSHGKPSIIYDYKCSGSQAYLKLAGELLKRTKAAKKKLITEMEAA